MMAITGLYFIILLLFVIFSYGFIDLNLHISSLPLFLLIQKPLETLVFHFRPIASLCFLCLLVCLFLYYWWFYKKNKVIFPTWKKTIIFLLCVSGILAFSFPALTYDMFNYITTAKVLFFHNENPYVVMPIEIPNEPYLSFTRAANKFALYGPIWLLITAIPHYLGHGNIWATIVVFKAMNALWYLLLSFVIYKATSSIKNVLFFALNPLVLIEVLISGHNDIYMMVFTIVGILFLQKNGFGNKIVGYLLFICSILIKGASIVLLPLFFIKNLSRERFVIISYWLFSIIFFIAGPLREELYPWYAVWLISIASLVDIKKHDLLIGFTVVLSFALELRHIPYMYMGEYGGVGPLIRTLLTIVPLILYGIYITFRKGWLKKLL